MNKLLSEEFIELAYEVTNTFIYWKDECQLKENSSCQIMAIAFCNTFWGLVEPKDQTRTLNKHREKCLSAILHHKELAQKRESVVEAVRLYEGQIPLILERIERVYKDIPCSIKEADSNLANHGRALHCFLDDVYRLLAGTNNQESFQKPEFMKELA